MKGQCKERPGVEEAEGGRRKRQEQVVMTRTLPANRMATEKGVAIFKPIFKKFYLASFLGRNSQFVVTPS